MALYVKGKKIESLYYKGKKIQSLWYKGQKIYSAYLPTGTVLWSGSKGFISKYPDGLFVSYISDSDKSNELLVAQSLTLNKPITKIKAGLTVNVSSKVLEYYPQNTGDDWSTPDAHTSINATILSGRVSLADLQNRVAVKIATAEYEVYVQAVDDTHLTFTSYRGTMANNDRVSNTSTLISSFDGSVDYLIIDSITAY